MENQDVFVKGRIRVAVPPDLVKALLQNAYGPDIKEFLGVDWAQVGGHLTGRRPGGTATQIRPLAKTSWFSMAGFPWGQRNGMFSRWR